MKKYKFFEIALRLVMGFIFLWSFLDKTFGLGYATAPDKAWISGGSPTYGFLSMASKGPFASIFHNLAGLAIVDWLFMLGLLCVGLTLLFNKYVKIGAFVGSAMLLLMYLALLFPANTPFIDDHIVYVLVLLLIAFKSENK